MHRIVTYWTVGHLSAAAFTEAWKRYANELRQLHPEVTCELFQMVQQFDEYVTVEEWPSRPDAALRRQPTMQALDQELKGLASSSSETEQRLVLSAAA
jgi:hypothetical protein